MSGLLPSHLEQDVTPEGDGELRVLSLTDDDAERLIGSVSSETARSILAALEERPATASELADSVSTSLQNVRHHLGNLQEAGLVEVAGTRYSVKGREMKVYAPSQDSLVVVGSEAVASAGRSGVVSPPSATSTGVGPRVMTGRSLE